MVAGKDAEFVGTDGVIQGWMGEWRPGLNEGRQGSWMNEVDGG